MIKEDIHFRYTMLHGDRVIKGEKFVNASNFEYGGDRKWLDNVSSVHTFIIICSLNQCHMYREESILTSIKLSIASCLILDGSKYITTM